MNADKTKKRRLFSYLRSSAFICGSLLFVPLFICGCEKSDEVVLYTSIDEPVARPIVQEFEHQTGIRVRLVTDSEATKTVGLAERLRAEKPNPQADVWWGNEPFNTINLADEGVLAAYDSPAAKDVPARFKDAAHRWASVGLRARVLAVYEQIPTTQPWTFRSDPSVRHMISGSGYPSAIAKPTAGTTGGHVSALYVLWGEQKFDQFVRDVAAGGHVMVLGGNSVVAENVGRGTAWVGLTDNDDVTAAQSEGGKLTALLPDQKTFGTLAIPSTVAMVAGAMHGSEARRLIDYLLSPAVERRLIDAKFAGWSVRAGDKDQPKWMDVDYQAVARAMPQAIRRATAILEGRE